VRGTIRVFRFDRVVSAFDLRTGRMLTGEEHAAILSPYLPQHVCEPDVAAMRRLHEAARPGVFLLLQLAMAEGRLGDLERAIVMDYVWAEAEALELAFPAEHALLWLDNLAPPLEAIVAAVEELLAQKDKFARLLPRLLKLVRIRDGAAQEQSVTDLFAAVQAEYRQKLGQSTATATARAGEGVPRRDRPAVA
jgi:hypothetical protein